MLKARSVATRPAMPTPAWLTTVKFTTGGPLTVTPVMVVVSAVEAVSAAVLVELPPAVAPAPVAPVPPPDPPPHPARLNATRPTTTPRMALPLPKTRPIQSQNDRFLFMTTPMFADMLLPIQNTSETTAETTHSCKYA